MIHGILQFTPSIAFCYVLHRCESLDIRCRESFVLMKRRRLADAPDRDRDDGSALLRCKVPWRVPRRGSLFAREGRREPPPARARGTTAGRAPGASRTGGGAAEWWARARSAPPRSVITCSRVVRRFDNDPSAGSPTETLLRLLLPLNDKVQWTSRDVAGGGPPTSPRSEHFTGPFNR